MPGPCSSSLSLFGLLDFRARSAPAPLLDFLEVPRDAVLADIHRQRKVPLGDPAVDRGGHESVPALQVAHSEEDKGIFCVRGLVAQFF